MKPRPSQLAQAGAVVGAALVWDGAQWSPTHITGERLVEDGVTPPVDLTLEDGSDYLYTG